MAQTIISDAAVLIIYRERSRINIVNLQSLKLFFDHLVSIVTKKDKKLQNTCFYLYFCVDICYKLCNVICYVIIALLLQYLQYVRLHGNHRSGDTMKKKAIGILISLAFLLTFMLGSASAALAAGPDIRVKINIGSTTQFAIKVCGDSYNANGVALANGGTYTVRLENGDSVNLYDSNNQLVCPVGPPNATLIISSAAEMETVKLTHPTNSERDYLGELRFTISGGSLQLVNHLNIERYLYGVVPYEMNDSFHIEALKAQAVAARTYAANRMKGAAGAYDLVDNTNDQVYKGYDSTKINAIGAVDATAGQVLKYGDDYVQCYYSASNGGWTDITQHRWSTSEPLKAYNQIKPDPYDIANPSSKQEVLILPRSVTPENPIQYKQQVDGSLNPTENSPTGVANASRYLRLSALPAVAAKGYLASVTDDIEIVSFSNIVAHTYDGKHGGADGYNGNDVTGKNDCQDMIQADVTMTVLASHYTTPATGEGYLLGDVDMNGSINISDYTLVRLHILGIKGLSSDALTIGDVDRNETINISDYTNIRLHILGLKAITGRTNDGLVREPIEVTFTIDFPAMDVGGAYQSFFDGSLGMFVVQSDDANWYIYQRRYGHGIGMSQRGAQQQANEGRTYTQILDFYYPNYSGYPAVTLASLY